jgi:DNA-binding CsgD family transcriptional regulator
MPRRLTAALLTAAFDDDEAAHLFCRLDEERAVVLANRAFAALTGYEPTDLEGVPSAAVWVGEEPGSAGGRAALRHADGSVVEVVVSERRLLVVAGVAYTLDRFGPAASRPRRMASAEAVAALTPRQREVLALLAAGASSRDIADELVISVATARNHVAAILGALGCGTRLRAVAIWHEAGA